MFNSHTNGTPDALFLVATLVGGILTFFAVDEIETSL